MRRGFGWARQLAAGVVAAAATAVIAVASPVTAAPPEGSVRGVGAAGAIADQYIVVFKGGSAPSRRVPSAARELAMRYGGALGTSYEGTVRGFSARLTAAGARRLAADPAVAFVEQDRVVSASGTQKNPPSWGLDRIDQRAPARSRSYTYARSASNVRAYIIDTGIRVDHRDFGGRASNGWDFVDNDRVANDCNGHGTHVAGTVGGSAYGVAKGVKLVAVRVLDCRGSGRISKVIAGIDWVTRHAIKPAVANLSLGAGASSALDEAVRASIASGVTYAVAAGNNHTNACSTSPARVITAITVGASGSNDRRASFSNYGPCLDLFAPGVNIISTGKGSRTARAMYSGTSMAAPHVAGAAAEVLALHPRYTPQQVRDALVAGSTLGRVANRGTGSPNRLLYSLSLTAPVPPAPPGGCQWRANNTDYTVPQNGFVESSVSFSGCTTPTSGTPTVEVHVRWTPRGHVSVTLIAPNGMAYLLKAENETDLTRGFDSVYTVSLPRRSRNGVWRVRIAHHVGAAIGYLNGWTLRL
jgi:subtilisin family serine protease